MMYLLATHYGMLPYEGTLIARRKKQVVVCMSRGPNTLSQIRNTEELSLNYAKV